MSMPAGASVYWDLQTGRRSRRHDHALQKAQSRIFLLVPSGLPPMGRKKARSLSDSCRHCALQRRQCLVLKQATPYIFTFKLWDWGRLGLDGIPRPIQQITHGQAVIHWERDAEWARALSSIKSPPYGRSGWREDALACMPWSSRTRRHWGFFHGNHAARYPMAPSTC